MIGEVLRIGDLVTVTVEQENRNWGYNPCPDGTVVEIVGITEITHGRTRGLGREPGVYQNTAWFKVRNGDPVNGIEWTEWSGRFTMVDTDEYDVRVNTWRASGAPHGGPKLRDLPDLPFWEDDRVSVEGVPDADRIVGISYDYLGQTVQDGSEWPIYEVGNAKRGWYTARSTRALALVERGNVWKYYHGEALSFADLQEELDFYRSIGRTEQVRNPATELYTFTKDEALDAIKSGLGHAITVGGVAQMFGGLPNTFVIRYLDDEVGRRAAASTLEGFGVTV